MANRNEADVTPRAATDVLTRLVLAIDEQSPDFGPALAFARRGGQEVNWRHVRHCTKRSPFARAFFDLVEELDLVPRSRLASTVSIRVPGWLPPIVK